MKDRTVAQRNLDACMSRAPPIRHERAWGEWAAPNKHLQFGNIPFSEHVHRQILPGAARPSNLDHRMPLRRHTPGEQQRVD